MFGRSKPEARVKRREVRSGPEPGLPAQVVVLALVGVLLVLPLTAKTACRRQASPPACPHHCQHPMTPQRPVSGTTPCCQTSPALPVALVQGPERDSHATLLVLLPEVPAAVALPPEPWPLERAGPPRAAGHSPQALNCVFLV